MSAHNLFPILPVMQKRGASCSPEEFHRIVNLTFHQYEAQVYDEIHHSMRSSLPRQFDLLVADVAQLDDSPGHGLRALDIGCGTGLSSELLLATSLGERIEELHLLDPSPHMLEKASAASAHWRPRVRLIGHRRIRHWLGDIPHYSGVLRPSPHTGY